ncbi:hypothetical 24.6 kDa integral membrane protein (plasmid) [Sinorhizobium fredii NGR234]|uniref:Uncharacterized protein y4fD n=1 Tax=Sinorhizobium fredii (strain NBRC 101917 / NGR234) TaxID=394 RepID=Y4FD_SINFN|nr:hypothetical protein [Sinorhizobium fredii]P55442.1 RecName: Full=Uncharacterized protein y4fD [Sinorhizobium fredii NGR234]AAB91661.1 hypothetical 24.6 kDa integral membrane protein [Sinorhizobium fredii NGR234]
MTQETLRKLWITLAILTLVVMINIHGSTQKSDFALIIKLPIELKFDGELTREAYAVHGMRFFALFFWLVPFLAVYHAKRSSGSASEAFPFRLLDIEPRSRPGKWVQGIAFVVLICLPLLTAIHLWRIVVGMQVCQHVSNALVNCADIWSRPVNAGPWDDTYRLANWGPTYDPLVEPVLAVILTAVSVYLTLRLVIEMRRAGSRPVATGNTPAEPITTSVT